MKKYVLIAGVNGAGKSTLYQTLPNLQNMPRVNTDEILKEFGDWRNAVDVMRAGKVAVKRIAQYLNEEITFNQETTLCGKSILNNIDKAKKKERKEKMQTPSVAFTFAPQRKMQEFSLAAWCGL